MNSQTLHYLYNERLPEIEKIIDMESNGNPDLLQEGLLGAYQALQTDPHASKQFLLNKATWEMVSSLRKGKSVDNGFYKRKNLKIIHYEHLPLADGIFAEAGACKKDWDIYDLIMNKENCTFRQAQPQ